ncbi:hypothetical protein RIR_jg28862.t1 [Rhizophagus irregularis DAOM 181602=DAOM 197198]|nr:hypothetical protein RIR_jg28862.t1 [Rhizophagus irregularis DAOM 181602=DAOM 197198]
MTIFLHLPFQIILLTTVYLIELNIVTKVIYVLLNTLLRNTLQVFRKTFEYEVLPRGYEAPEGWVDSCENDYEWTTGKIMWIN